MKPLLAGLLVMALARFACLAGQSWVLCKVATALWQGASLPGVSGDLAAVFLLFAAGRAFGLLQDGLLDRNARKQTGRLYSLVAEGVFDPARLSARRLGAARVLDMLQGELDDVERYLRVMPPKIVDLAAIAAPLAALELAVDPASGVIVAVSFPVIVFFMVLLGRQSRERAERQYGAYRRLSNRFLDTLRGIEAIVAAGAQQEESDAVLTYSERLRKATLRTLRSATLSSCVLDLIATFAVAAVAMMLAFRLMDGSIALDRALLALMLAPECLAPLRRFAGDFHASLDGKVALDHMLEALAPQAVDGERPASSESPEALPHQATGAPQVVFDDVSFSYSGSDHPVLDRVSFEASGPQRIALIGKSGAGKSTFAALAAGLTAPTGGSVRVRGKAHFIPQDPHVFAASIAENIAFYCPDAPRERIESAAIAVGLGPLLGELPAGIDTVVGDGGHGLSGGQAHRIALARALVDDEASILVFDEPTAQLDIATEHELKQRMLPLMEGKLVVFATHRLHWLAEMDRVVEVRDSGLRELVRTRESAEAEGTPSELVGLSAAMPVCSRTSAFASGDGDAEQAEPAPSAEERAADASSPADSRRPLGRSADESASAQVKSGKRHREWLFGLVRAHARQASLAVLLSIVATACAVLLMLTAGYLIADCALPATTLFSIMVPVGLVQVFGLAKPLARYAERLASHDWVFRVTSDLRLRLFRSALARALDPLERRSAGDYFAALAEDVESVQNLFVRGALPLASAFASGLVLACGAFLLSPGLGIAAAWLLAVVAVLLPLAYGILSRRGTEHVLLMRRTEASELANDVFGSLDWVLSGMSARALGAHMAADSRMRHLQARTRLEERLFAALAELAICAFVCYVLAWCPEGLGAAQASANWAVALSIGLFPLAEVYAQLPAAVSAASRERLSVRRLDELLASEAPQSGEAGIAAHQPTKDRDGVAIEISHATYSYPGSKTKALDDVSLHVEPRGKVALIGASGSGKTTLAKIASGLLSPDRAPACSAFPGNTVRERTGYLNQRPYLLNRTLRDNLKLGAPAASDDEIEESLRQVGLSERVARLRHGLDTFIGETGEGLSGGEAHRVALARVLLRDTPLVIVDEPFASLDLEAEDDLLSCILESCCDKTLLVITHHLAQIERFDEVVFVEQGKIVLKGAPHELARTDPRFKELVNLDRSTLESTGWR